MQPGLTPVDDDNCLGAELASMLRRATAKSASWGCFSSGRQMPRPSLTRCAHEPLLQVPAMHDWQLFIPCAAEHSCRWRTQLPGADLHDSPLHAQIREQNPRLAKQSSVLSVSMDAVYSFATSPRESSNASGVVFRFMPDALQVEAALNASHRHPHPRPHRRPHLHPHPHAGPVLTSRAVLPRSCTGTRAWTCWASRACRCSRRRA